jgi:hypothetical protein
VPLCEVPADGPHEQVWAREHRADERDERRDRGERDDHDPNQREARHEREYDNRPQEDDPGRPFNSVPHVSTAFLVRVEFVMR